MQKRKQTKCSQIPSSFEEQKEPDQRREDQISFRISLQVNKIQEHTIPVVPKIRLIIQFQEEIFHEGMFIASYCR